MLIFLYGPDSYRRQKKLNYYIEEYKKKYSNLSCDFFDFDPLTGSGQEEFFRLKEFSSQLSIFDNKKLAVLKNIYKIDFQEFKNFLEPYSDDKNFTILISEENFLSPELNFLEKKAFSIEKFDNLKGDKWRFFIQKEVRERNITFTPGALNFLAETFEGDTWGLINELEKLNLFSSGLVNKDATAPASTKLVIDTKDLEKIGDYHYESPDIFDYINAVSRDWPLARRIIALEKLFISQEEPIKIFNILASLKQLPTKLIQRLADYDVMVKSGKMDYEEVLLDLALKER